MFDHKKIISGYETEKAVVGKEYYFSDCYTDLSKGKALCAVGTLAAVGDGVCSLPFLCEGGTYYQFIYPVEKKLELMTNEELMYLLAHCEVVAKTADAGIITTDWTLSSDEQLHEQVKDGTMVRGFFGKSEWEPATKKFFNWCIGADDE